MKSTITLTLILLGSLCLPAAAADRPDLSRAQADRLLQARWDGDESRIILAPGRAGDLSRTRPQLDVMERFERGLDTVVEPDEVFAAVEATAGGYTATSKKYEIQANRERMQFVVRDLRGYESRPGEKQRSEDELVEEARALLVGLVGAAEGETIAYSVRNLGAEDMEPGMRAGESRPRLVARKVFFQRVVAGVPVMGDAAVVGFSPRGDFRKFWASWHQVDLAKSRLDSRLDMDAFTARAADALLERDIDLRSGYPIGLGTCYRVAKSVDGRAILELRGYATVPTRGPDGMGTGQVIDFSL